NNDFAFMRYQFIQLGFQFGERNMNCANDMASLKFSRITYINQYRFIAVEQLRHFVNRNRTATFDFFTPGINVYQHEQYAHQEPFLADKSKEIHRSHVPFIKAD